MTVELLVSHHPTLESNLATMLIRVQNHACPARIQVRSLCAACSQMSQRILGVASEPPAGVGHASAVGRMCRWEREILVRHAPRTCRALPLLHPSFALPPSSPHLNSHQAHCRHPRSEVRRALLVAQPAINPCVCVRARVCVCPTRRCVVPLCVRL